MPSQMVSHYPFEYCLLDKISRDYEYWIMLLDRKGTILVRNCYILLTMIIYNSQFVFNLQKVYPYVVNVSAFDVIEVAHDDGGFYRVSSDQSTENLELRKPVSCVCPSFRQMHVVHAKALVIENILGDFLNVGSLKDKFDSHRNGCCFTKFDCRFALS